MNIKVSILIPVYNTSKYLNKCLDSVLAQSYKDIEVIVVNDGSTDNSLEILNRYASIYSNIKVISQQNNGHQSARKVAIENSNGDFIAFLDSDDALASNDVIRKMVEVITIKTKIVVGRINIDNGNTLKVFHSSVFSTINTKEYLQNYLLCGKSGWNLAGKLFSRQMVTTVRSDTIKVTAGEDALYVISMTASVNGDVTMINVPVYNYFIRIGSITQSKNIKNISDNLKVAKYVDTMLTNQINNKYRVAFRLLCLSNSFRYGWLGINHNLYSETINKYKQTTGVLPLFSFKKRLQIWTLINFGDLISKYIFKNRVYEK